MRIAGSFAAQSFTRNQTAGRSPNASTRKLQERSRARQKAIEFYGDDDNTLERFKSTARPHNSSVTDNTLKRFSTEHTDVTAMKIAMGVNPEDEESSKHFKSPKVIWQNHRLFHPSSPKKIAWDMVLGILVLYSVISVSYRIGFDNPAPEGGTVSDKAFNALNIIKPTVYTFKLKFRKLKLKFKFKLQCKIKFTFKFKFRFCNRF